MRVWFPSPVPGRMPVSALPYPPGQGESWVAARSRVCNHTAGTLGAQSGSELAGDSVASSFPPHVVSTPLTPHGLCSLMRSIPFAETASVPVSPPPGPPAPGGRCLIPEFSVCVGHPDTAQSRALRLGATLGAMPCTGGRGEGRVHAHLLEGGGGPARL